MGDTEKARELEARQLRYAKHWEVQWKPPIPDDEWPREWHIANRWRCINGHVCIGVNRLHYCRACSIEGLANVPVVRTSPQDITGPFDFDAELAKWSSKRVKIDI